jgi:hypothetical protein
MLAYLRTESSSGKLASEALPKRGTQKGLAPADRSWGLPASDDASGQLAFFLSGSVATTPCTSREKRDLQVNPLPASAALTRWGPPTISAHD